MEHAFDGGALSLAALAKKYGQFPVIANGGLGDPARAAELIASGQADVVALGQAALTNHDWVNKVAAGERLSDFNVEPVLQPNAKLK